MQNGFAFIPVASSLVQTRAELEQLAGDYLQALTELGGTELDPGKLDTAQPLVYFIATGGTEGTLLKLWEERNRTIPGEPVILLTHPGHNSLPAGLELLARLQQAGTAGRIIYLDGCDSIHHHRQLKEMVHALHTQRALAAARIGLIGTASDWLVASSPSTETVSARWGPVVVPVAMEECLQEIHSIDSQTVQLESADPRRSADAILEPTGHDLDDVTRVYLALTNLVARYNLTALSLRCFDFVEELKTTGCYALARLNEEGIMAGCEGDLVSTIGMLWAYHFLEQTPWMANPAQLNVEANTLTLAHCTVPRTLVNHHTLRTHFESGLGVGIQGDFPPGPVTLFRIGGQALDQLWTAEGGITTAGHAENLCRTQIEVQLSHGKVRDLLETPLGNHLILVNGHHAQRLHAWAALMIS